MSGRRFSTRFAVLVLAGLTFWTLLGPQQGAAPKPAHGDASLLVPSSTVTSHQAAIRLGKDAPREQRHLLALPDLTPGWRSLGTGRAFAGALLIDPGPSGLGVLRTRAPPVQNS